MSDLTNSAALAPSATPLTEEQTTILKAVAQRHPGLRNIRYNHNGSEIHADQPFLLEGKMTHRLSITALDSARYWAGLDDLPVDPMLAQNQGGNPLAGEARRRLENVRATGKP